ncbi:MAG: hypothetical protein MH204_04575, partial [Fimbriimonadaceae bacterium]|nr:hypothetical protein [Fimbriimonadaceae bacterium]
VVGALNPTNGVTYWFTEEVGGAATAGPSFTYLTVNNNASLLTANTAALVVPTDNGSLVALDASGAANSQGSLRVWQFNADQGPATSVATGGWRFGDFRSWMYAGDGAGILYAFNGNDDINPNPITPGVPPGDFDLVENDPGFGDLNGVLNQNNIQLLSPEGFETLSNAVLNDTLTSAQLATLAANESVTRRTFEVGETLYVVIRNLPDLTGSVGPYQIRMRINSGGQVIDRLQPVQPISSLVAASATSQLWFAAVPILPNNRGLRAGSDAIVSFQVQATGRPVSSSEVLLDYTDTVAPGLADGVLRVANPLGVLFAQSDAANSIGASSGGNTTNVYAPTALGRTDFLDAGTADGPRAEKFTADGLLAPTPGGWFGPTTATSGNLSAHAAQAKSAMQVIDRSLSMLVLGTNRGLQNVRMEGRDLEWQVTLSGTLAIEANQNIFRPFSRNTQGVTPVNYGNIEDRPQFRLNRSLDDPNIDASALGAARSRAGRVENPVASRVSLLPPSFTAANLTTYRSAAGFDAQLTRTLSTTPFELQLNVPRYQPASGPETTAGNLRRGYRGTAVVYLDGAGQGSGFVSTDPNRQVVLGVRVAPDVSVRVVNPPLDFGSLPAGSGWNGGPLVNGRRTWANPLDHTVVPQSAYAPTNPEYRNNGYFRPLEVVNEGNVNLLNVRIAKNYKVRRPGGSVSVEPFRATPTDAHEMAWLPAGNFLLSDIDFKWSPLRLSGLDAEGRAIIPKARVGDSLPTQLSSNPVRRANPFLNENGNTGVDPTSF